MFVHCKTCLSCCPGKFSAGKLSFFLDLVFFLNLLLIRDYSIEEQNYLPKLVFLKKNSHKSRIAAELPSEVESWANILDPVKPGAELLQQAETKKNDTRVMQGLDSTHRKCSYWWPVEPFYRQWCCLSASMWLLLPTLAVQTLVLQTGSFSRLIPRESLKAPLGFSIRLFRAFYFPDCPTGLRKSELLWKNLGQPDKNCPLGIPSGCAVGNSRGTVFPGYPIGFSTFCPTLAPYGPQHIFLNCSFNAPCMINSKISIHLKTVRQN